MKLKKQRWQRVTVTLPAGWEEVGTAILIDLGAEGVWVENANGSVGLNVFFSERDRAKASVLRRRLGEKIPLKKIPIQSVFIPEEAWQTAWQAHSVPRQRVGQRLMVAPPWDLPAPGRSKRVLMQIEPAMAFGTGTHPTTRSCLLFLEQCIDEGKAGSLLDVGTGSGILAIAAAKLGAVRVTGVENDPVALSAAKENAALNGVASRIVFRKTIPRGAGHACLVANLTAPVLIALAPVLVRSVPKRGKIILSGMLREQAAVVLERFRPSALLLKSRKSGAWVTLLLARR